MSRIIPVPRKAAALPRALAAVLALGACTGIEDQGPAAGTVPVIVGDNFFQPETVTVVLGRVVRWTNHGAAPHRVASSNALWQSNPLPTNFWFEVRFDSVGTFDYACLVDSTHTETGTVIVLP